MGTNKQLYSMDQTNQKAPIKLSPIEQAAYNVLRKQQIIVDLKRNLVDVNYRIDHNTPISISFIRKGKNTAVARMLYKQEIDIIKTITREEWLSK